VIIVNNSKTAQKLTLSYFLDAPIFRTVYYKDKLAIIQP